MKTFLCGLAVLVSAGLIAALPLTSAVAAPLATSEGETSGLSVEVTEFKRTSGGTVNLKFAMINSGDKEVAIHGDYAEPSSKNDFGSIGGVTLVDAANKKKYFVVRDSDGNCVCSTKIQNIKQGTRAVLWAKFPAPPADVKSLSISVPHFAPMDDVPLQ